jgi:endonuclease/exonuclease/phosphatase (EEP) superfamily protein YafD
MSDAPATAAGQLARPGGGFARLARQGGLGLVVAAYFAVAAASCLGRYSWLADLTTHFRPQLLVAALVLAVMLLLGGRPRWLLPLALAASVHAFVLFRPAPAPAAVAEGSSLRLLAFNVLTDNSRFDEVLGFIRREAPDVVVLTEASQPWQERVESLTARFPYTTLSKPRAIDTVVLSRFRILEQSIEHAKGRKGRKIWEPALRLVLDVDGKPTVLWAIHPASPINKAQWNRRNIYLKWLATRVAAEPERLPVIVAGDFNITPWSPWYDDWKQGSGLIDSAGTNWPAITRRPFLPFHARFLGVPIDRVAISPVVAVTSHRVGPELGSDHYALTVDLTLPKRSP